MNIPSSHRQSRKCAASMTMTLNNDDKEAATAAESWSREREFSKREKATNVLIEKKSLSEKFSVHFMQMILALALFLDECLVFIAPTASRQLEEAEGGTFVEGKTTQFLVRLSKLKFRNIPTRARWAELSSRDLCDSAWSCSIQVENSSELDTQQCITALCEWKCEMNRAEKWRPRGNRRWMDEIIIKVVPETWTEKKHENYICLFTREYNFKYNIISSKRESDSLCEIQKKLVCNEQHAHGT